MLILFQADTDIVLHVLDNVLPHVLLHSYAVLR